MPGYPIASEIHLLLLSNTGVQLLAGKAFPQENFRENVRRAEL